MAEVVITVSDTDDGDIKIRTQFVPPLQTDKHLTDAQTTGHLLMQMLERSGEDVQTD